MEFGMDSIMERRALARGYDAEHRIQDYPGGRKNSWFQCSTLKPFVNAPRWRVNCMEFGK